MKITEKATITKLSDTDIGKVLVLVKPRKTSQFGHSDRSYMGEPFKLRKMTQGCLYFVRMGRLFYGDRHICLTRCDYPDESFEYWIGD